MIRYIYLIALILLSVASPARAQENRQECYDPAMGPFLRIVKESGTTDISQLIRWAIATTEFRTEKEAENQGFDLGLSYGELGFDLESSNNFDRLLQWRKEHKESYRSDSNFSQKFSTIYQQFDPVAYKIFAECVGAASGIYCSIADAGDGSSLIFFVRYRGADDASPSTIIMKSSSMSNAYTNSEKLDPATGAMIRVHSDFIAKGTSVGRNGITRQVYREDPLLSTTLTVSFQQGECSKTITPAGRYSLVATVGGEYRREDSVTNSSDFLLTHSNCKHLVSYYDRQICLSEGDLVDEAATNPATVQPIDVKSSKSGCYGIMLTTPAVTGNCANVQVAIQECTVLEDPVGCVTSRDPGHTYRFTIRGKRAVTASLTNIDFKAVNQRPRVYNIPYEGVRPSSEIKWNFGVTITDLRTGEIIKLDSTMGNPAMSDGHQAMINKDGMLTIIVGR